MADHVAGFVDGIVKGDIVGCVTDAASPGGFATVVCHGTAGSRTYTGFRFRPGTPKTGGIPGRYGFAIPLRDVAGLGRTLRLTTASGTLLQNGVVNIPPGLDNVPADQQQYIFIHLQKTAGTAVADCLRDLLPQSAFVGIYPTPAWISQAEFIALTPHEKHGFRVAFGHLYVNSTLNIQLRNPRFLTFLRNPMARIRSNYWMLRRNAENPVHEGKPVKASDIVNNALTDEFDNLQTRMLAGTGPGDVGIGAMTEQNLGLALHNIAQRFDLIGFSEHADEDFQKLCRLLKLPPMTLARANESAAQDESDADFKRLDWSRIIHNNRFDIALYQILAERRQAAER